jgi:hypothetical protein
MEFTWCSPLTLPGEYHTTSYLLILFQGHFSLKLALAAWPPKPRAISGRSRFFLYALLDFKKRTRPIMMGAPGAWNLVSLFPRYRLAE